MSQRGLEPRSWNAPLPFDPVDRHIDNSEIQRVLKPGGLAVFTWSNRMFPQKAIHAWRAASEPERLWICGSYFHYTGGFAAPIGQDISPYPGRSDPVYVVHARKHAPASTKAEL